MNVVVVVDIAVFIQTANRGMKVGNFAFRFRMKPNRVFATRQIGRTGTDFSILAGNHQFVELLGEFLPKILPIFDVIELGMLRRWTQLYSDYGILYRPILG